MLSIACSAVAEFEEGHYYSGDYGNSNIIHYDEAGATLGTVDLTSGVASSIRDLAFGPDGLLYAVVIQSGAGVVLALDDTMAVQETYTGAGGLSSNIWYGNIVFDDSNHFYVASGSGLTEFTIGNPSSANLLFSGGLYGVGLLPNGNFIIALDPDVREVTPTGTVVRDIDTSYSYTNLRSLAHDRANQTAYVFMLGYSGNFNKIMHIDVGTGNLLREATFTNTMDIAFTNDVGLILGSRSLTPAYFSKKLEQGPSLTGPVRSTVAQVPVTPQVPALNAWMLTLLVASIGMAGACLAIRRRSAAAA